MGPPADAPRKRPVFLAGQSEVKCAGLCVSDAETARGPGCDPACVPAGGRGGTSQGQPPQGCLGAPPETLQVRGARSRGGGCPGTQPSGAGGPPDAAHLLSAAHWISRRIQLYTRRRYMNMRTSVRNPASVPPAPGCGVSFWPRCIQTFLCGNTSAPCAQNPDERSGKESNAKL